MVASWAASEGAALSDDTDDTRCQGKKRFRYDRSRDKNEQERPRRCCCSGNTVGARSLFPSRYCPKRALRNDALSQSKKKAIRQVRWGGKRLHGTLHLRTLTGAGFRRPASSTEGCVVSYPCCTYARTSTKIPLLPLRFTTVHKKKKSHRRVSSTVWGGVVVARGFKKHAQCPRATCHTMARHLANTTCSCDKRAQVVSSIYWIPYVQAILPTPT